LQYTVSGVLICLISFVKQLLLMKLNLSRCLTKEAGKPFLGAYALSAFAFV
jgi:hypothetical protein